MQVRVNSTSISKNRQRAQVMVLIGEGRNRRSVIRHIKKHATGKKSFGWFGLNPDERAVPLNELYEDELTIAKSNLASAEAAVKSLEKKLEDIEKAPDGADIVTESMLLAAYEVLQGQLEIAQDNVYQTTAVVDDAEEKLAIVQQEVPLEVEFVGPGLTY